MSEWGEDPDKWVIQKSAFGGGWLVLPPHDGEPSIVPNFPFPQTADPSDETTWHLPCWKQHPSFPPLWCAADYSVSGNDEKGWYVRKGKHERCGGTGAGTTRNDVPA